MRHIAIDWSGAKQDARSKSWLAEVHLVPLESGRSRAEIIDELVPVAKRDDAYTLRVASFDVDETAQQPTDGSG